MNSMKQRFHSLWSSQITIVVLKGKALIRNFLVGTLLLLHRIHRFHRTPCARETIMDCGVPVREMIMDCVRSPKALNLRGDTVLG